MRGGKILARQRTRRPFFGRNQNRQRSSDSIQTNKIAVPNLGDGAAIQSFGLRWIAAGTLPEAPDIRPSVTSATLQTPILQDAERRASGLCNSGMPLARGP